MFCFFMYCIKKDDSETAIWSRPKMKDFFAHFFLKYSSAQGYPWFLTVKYSTNELKVDWRMFFKLSMPRPFLRLFLFISVFCLFFHLRVLISSFQNTAVFSAFEALVFSCGHLKWKNLSSPSIYPYIHADQCFTGSDPISLRSINIQISVVHLLA